MNVSDCTDSDSKPLCTVDCWTLDIGHVLILINHKTTQEMVWTVWSTHEETWAKVATHVDDRGF